MITTCIVLAFVAVLERGNSIEIARSQTGQLFTTTESRAPYGNHRVAMLLPEFDRLVVYTNDHPWRESVEADRRKTGLPDPELAGGSLIWGLTPETVFHGWQKRWPGPRFSPLPGIESQEEFEHYDITLTEIGASATALADTIILAHQRDEAEAREAAARYNSMLSTHACYCAPLVDYIVKNAEPLARDWNLFLDLFYTSINNVTAVAVRDGQIMWWTLDQLGNVHAPWTTHDSETTRINTPFRVMRAGPDLANQYLIDETGNIYTFPGTEGGGHRHIGSIETFDSGDPDILTLIFEDQMTQQIGILHADTKANVTPLAITWKEEGFAQDFYASLDDEQLRADIARMADVLRADRGR